MGSSGTTTRCSHNSLESNETLAGKTTGEVTAFEEQIAKRAKYADQSQDKESS